MSPTAIGEADVVISPRHRKRINLTPITNLKHHARIALERGVNSAPSPAIKVARRFVRGVDVSITARPPEKTCRQNFQRRHQQLLIGPHNCLDPRARSFSPNQFSCLSIYRIDVSIAGTEIDATRAHLRSRASHRALCFVTPQQFS